MSVNEWKKMRRKQQELVLKVWENVLETMKFRSANGKADFGTNLAGLWAPKSTPFDTALAALKELTGTPRFHNPCPGCVFLGSYQSGPPSMERADASDDPPREKTTWYDLYYCNQGHRVDKPMLTARFESALNTGDAVPEFKLDINNTAGNDTGYIVAEPHDCKHPVLKWARDNALKLDLITWEQAHPESTTLTLK